LSATSNGALSRATAKQIAELKTSRATLTGPAWIRYIEYGSATHRAESVPGAEPAEHFGITGPGQPYIIKPVHADALRFEGTQQEGFAEGVVHPGVQAFAPIRKILFDLRDTVKTKVNAVLGQGESLQTALLPAMQEAQQLIKQSIAQELGDTVASNLFDAESHINIEGLT
jgi:hypothetical protein